MAYREVWKFPLLSTGPCWIEMPRESRIVLVDRDPATGLLAMWAEVSPPNRKVERQFKVVGTGHSVPESALHLGSRVLGDLVWHLYEIPEAETNG